MDLIDLHRAMATLPDEQREALILVGAGGVAYDEAAQICGCAVGTIKSRVARARRAIMAALDGSGAKLPARTTGGDGATREICDNLNALIGADDGVLAKAAEMRGK
jgi:RNA polymerase sigma-70 factor (ECF subfamily)